ncbi:MAG: hypothetical protein NT172_01460 [Planctomycetota bacterium]|nr:hypothetical protein [Planctomycetota bacterium]
MQIDISIGGKTDNIARQINVLISEYSLLDVWELIKLDVALQLPARDTKDQAEMRQ